MDYGKVLKRAWHHAWHYRALWVLGIILVLTMFSWGTPPLYDFDGDRESWQGISITRLDGETFWQAAQRTLRAEIDEANRELDRFFAEVLGIRVRSNVVAYSAVLLGIAVTATIVAGIARYISEAALIRTVDEVERTGKRIGVWKALGMGWSRSAWRLFLIDVLVHIVGILAGIVVFGAILGPLPLWVERAEFVIFIGAFLTAGFLLMGIALMIAVATALSLVRRLAWRACAQQDLGVFASIRRGAVVLRKHLPDVGLVWLLTVAVRWGWRLAIAPIALLLVGVGTMVGGLPGVLVGGLTSLATSGDLPVFIGIAVGVPLFLLVLVAPLVFLVGLREVFLSTIWTLTYRELRPQEILARRPAPKVGASGLKSVPVAP